MVKKKMQRREFLMSSVGASALALAGLSFEEKALMAQVSSGAAPPTSQPAAFPRGKIGNLSISRLICGGNLISGFAHSRDLIYVSRLLKQYFTDEKVFETLALCESLGINTAILRLDSNTIRILQRYWKERGGKIQWIAQIHVAEDDFVDVKKAVDNGAVGLYTHGGVADYHVKAKKVDVLAKAVELGKQNKVIAGVAGHMLEVPVACEAAGIKPDFYMKTFNSKKYWSAQNPTKHDNVWEDEPEKTAEFMRKVTCPWIAYKVMGAGAIHPEEAFGYAYQNGADFICAGMFDFQVAEDVQLAIAAVDGAQKRERPWRG